MNQIRIDILRVEDIFVLSIKAPTYISMLWFTIVLESHFLFSMCVFVSEKKKNKTSCLSKSAK